MTTHTPYKPGRHDQSRMLSTSELLRLEDCQPGRSGRIYESLKHRVIISDKRPLKIQDLRMRAVGYCGLEEISNTIDVLADLERFADEDRSFRQPEPQTTAASDE